MGHLCILPSSAPECASCGATDGDGYLAIRGENRRRILALCPSCVRALKEALVALDPKPRTSIRDLQNELGILREQRAQFGLHVPPSIVMDIEKLEREIRDRVANGEGAA